MIVYMTRNRFIVVFVLILALITLGWFSSNIFDRPPANVKHAFLFASECAEGNALSKSCQFYLFGNAATKTLLAVFIANFLSFALMLGMMLLIHLLFRPQLQQISILTAALVAIPSIAWIPLILAVLGTNGLRSEVAFLVMGALPFFMFEAFQGMNNCDELKLNTIERGGSRKLKSFIHVLLPSCTQSLFQGLRISISVSFILSVVYGSFVPARGNLGLVIDPFNQDRGVAIGVFEAIQLLVISFLLGWLLIELVRILEISFLNAWKAREQKHIADSKYLKGI